jgi:uncharacterized delta-60 repeat protein
MPKQSLKKYRNLLLFLLTIFLLSSSIPRRANAADGDLDLTFGVGGKVKTDFSGLEDRATGVAVQQDGKIVVVGFSSLVATPATQGNSDFLIARYNYNGNLDNTFGTGGKVTTDFFGESDTAQALLIQPDGKILVAGSALNLGTAGNGTSLDYALARYNPNGTLDASFGNGGKVTTDFEFTTFGRSGVDFGNDVALAPNGKIVVAGYSIHNGDYFFSVARYNSNGSLDTSFGNNGRVLTRSSTSENIAYAVAIQPDGKIVIAGYLYSQPDYDFAVVRYNNDGSLDTGFGVNGIVTTDFAFLVSFDFAYDVAIQKDGKILVVGKTDNAIAGVSYFALTRYNHNGSLDTNFGTDGRVTSEILFPSIANAMAIQGDGKIVVAGWHGTSREDFDFAIARFNLNGSLDGSFGSGGKVSADLFGEMDFATAIALQADGKIVLAGVTRPQMNTVLYPQNEYDIALARFDGNRFDTCLQDESSSNLLQMNAQTGDYQFSNCSGFTLGGTGILTKRGSTVTLQHNSNDRRVMVSIDTNSNRATASLQILSQGRSFSITDRNITNNTCSCR